MNFKPVRARTGELNNSSGTAQLLTNEPTGNMARYYEELLR